MGPRALTRDSIGHFLLETFGQSSMKKQNADLQQRRQRMTKGPIIPEDRVIAGVGSHFELPGLEDLARQIVSILYDLEWQDVMKSKKGIFRLEQGIQLTRLVSVPGIGKVSGSSFPITLHTCDTQLHQSLTCLRFPFCAVMAHKCCCLLSFLRYF